MTCKNVTNWRCGAADVEKHDHLSQLAWHLIMVITIRNIYNGNEVLKKCRVHPLSLTIEQAHL